MLRYAKLALLAIAAITVASGALQLAAPALVLRTIGGDTAPAAAHSFRIVGMFMILFGGLMWQSVRAEPVLTVPLLWAALQKLGAAGAVAAGVAQGLFAPVALLVAAFDLGSAVLAFWYRSRADTSLHAVLH